MTDLFCPAASPTLPSPTDWRSPDLPTTIAHLRGHAIALTGDHDEADDLVQETLIAAWQRGASLTPVELDRLLTEQCDCWQACRRTARASLGRLIADGDPLPPWLTGSSGDADGEAIVELVMLRLTIAERLRHPTSDQDAATGRDATSTARPIRPTVPLPAIPAELAADRPIAAALVRAGARIAPVTPAATPHVATTGRPRRGRAGPNGGVAAAVTATPARHDRLRAQLSERERATERAGRRLDELRHRYDRACTAEARVAAETALLAAAVRHERALAARRDLARRLADLLATPGLAAALARRERRR